MQVSKIVIGKLYAIRWNDRLVRFRPSAVVTRRESDHKNPHDYKSTVEGDIMEPDVETDRLTLVPDAVLGPYEEHIELVERQRQARREREQLETSEELRALFYRLIGENAPESSKDFRQKFRVGYSGTSVDIDSDGIAALRDALKKLVTETA